MTSQFENVHDVASGLAAWFAALADADTRWGRRGWDVQANADALPTWNRLAAAIGGQRVHVVWAEVDGSAGAVLGVGDVVELDLSFTISADLPTVTGARVRALIGGSGHLDVPADEWLSIVSNTT